MTVSTWFVAGVVGTVQGLNVTQEVVVMVTVAPWAVGPPVNEREDWLGAQVVPGTALLPVSAREQLSDTVPLYAEGVMVTVTASGCPALAGVGDRAPTEIPKELVVTLSVSDCECCTVTLVPLGIDTLALTVTG